MKHIIVGMILLATGCSTYNNGELETVDLSKYDELMEFHNQTMDKILDGLQELDPADLENRSQSSGVIKEVIVNEMVSHHTFNEEQAFRLKEHINQQVDELVSLDPHTTVYQYSLDKFNKKIRKKSSEGYTLSDVQIKVFNELHAQLEHVSSRSEIEEVAGKVNTLALETLEEQEREIVFASTAMLLNSVNYWQEHQDEWFALLPETTQNKLKALPDPWYIVVGKADMVGLVEGAVGGFVLGGLHGLIAGPGGAFSAALAGGTLGALGGTLTGSAGAAFKLLFP